MQTHPKTISKADRSLRPVASRTGAVVTCMRILPPSPPRVKGIVDRPLGPVYHLNLARFAHKTSVVKSCMIPYSINSETFELG